MGKRILLMILLLSLFLSLLSVGAQGAGYTEADWNELIEKYRQNLCGTDEVDWTDAEIQKIVGVKNSSGISTSGISYNGGRYWLDLESNRNNPGRVFGSKDITIALSSDTMRKQFVYLCYMAKAYGTPGTSYTYKDSSGNVQTLELYQNPDLRDAIFYGLEKSMTFFTYENWNKQHTGTYSTNYNWWDWTYGGQKEILQSLLILYPFQNSKEQSINDSLNALCLKLLDAIRPNNTGKNDNTSIGYRRVRLGVTPMIAALTKNTDLMEQSLTNMVDFMEDDPTLRDGVKQDYSYICHFYYPMEGTYGTDVLGNRIIDAYYVLSGTAFEPTTDLRENQFRWIMQTFRPVVHNGVLLAMNSGRYPNAGQRYAVDVLKAALRLVGCFGADKDLQIKQFIRSMVVQETHADTQKAYSSFAVSLGEVNLVQTLKEIVMDQTIPVGDEVYAHMRYSTDRAVQHREGYTVGIAMSSIRIGPYECVNGCNRYGWHTGDGMVYVYDDTTNYAYDQYGERYQRFANMYRVPGTTEEDATLRQPWSERAPYFTGMTYTHNEAAGKDHWIQDYDEDGTEACSFVGGVELDGQYITAAMEFEAYSWTEEEHRQELIKIHNSAQPDEYAERNKMKQVLVSDLSAKKSYFLFDDEIVCVGSDIDFSTRNNGVNTYVDNRELSETSVAGGETVYGTDDVSVEGTLLEKVNSFSEPKHFTDPKWIYGENFGGYYFPNGGEVYVNKSFRRSSNDGDDTNDDYNQINLEHNPTNGSHSFLEIWLSHGEAPRNGSYSYVMLPSKTEEETRDYSEDPHVTVLVCTEDLHVVREEELGITAMVFWKAGSYKDITVDQPMILMVQEQNGIYSLSLSDPTQKLSSGTVTVNRSLYTTHADEELQISGSGKTVIKVDFSKALGKSICATFAVEAEESLLFDFAQDRSYFSPSYSYTDYSAAGNWTVSGSAPTVSGGNLTLPLNANGTTELSAGKLSFNMTGTARVQLRLKVTGSTADSPKVYVSYLTDAWSAEVLLCTPDTSGDYVTYKLSLDLNGKTVRGIKLSFRGLKGGKAVLDYLSLGKEPEDLYFGFDSDRTVMAYSSGTYGGFDYLSNAWATNLTSQVGNFLSVTHGELQIYATEESNGTAGSDHGIYVETTAQPGKYPWNERSRHALSYDPENAQILEVRFKTEDLVATPGKTPLLTLLYTKEVGGTVTRVADLTAAFSISNGEYLTLRIPVDDAFRSADFIKSLGLRFRYTKSVDADSVGKISIDYIYLGSRENAPSSVYFDFEDSDRYDRGTYGSLDYSQGNWSYSSSRLTAPVMENGTLSMTMEQDNKGGSLYLQTGPYLTQKFPLDLSLKDKEVIQLKVKLENFSVGSNARVAVYYYTTRTSHLNNKDRIRMITETPLTQGEVNGEWLLLTLPIPEEKRQITDVSALRANFSGLGMGDDVGRITFDYIYLGSYALAPEQTSLFFDFDGGAEDLLRYEGSAYGMTDFDDPENWWVNSSYATDPVIEKGILTFASTNTEGRSNHYIHSGWTHNVLPLNYTPKVGDICKIRFSIEHAVCNLTDDKGVFQLYYGIGSNATAGYDQVEFYVSELSDKGYVTLSFPMDSEKYLAAEKISSLRFQFGRILSTEGECATFYIDYLYVGPESTAPAQESTLFADFTDTYEDQLRYGDKVYGEKNLDLSASWWTNSANDEKPVVDDGVMLIKASQGSTSTIHYALSCETFGAYPLQYSPKAGDVCQMRIKLEKGVSTRSDGTIRLSLLYGVKDNNSAGFDYVEFGAADYMDQGWATITFPMDSANYASAPQIGSIRPQISYVTSGDGEQFCFYIDYIYLGQEEGLPAKDAYYLADFNGTLAGQERYQDKLYGNTDPDLPESWWTNSTYATAPVVEGGAMTLYSKLDTRTDHYFHSGPAHNVYPLAFRPGQEDYCQVRLKIENAVSTKTNGTARFSLYFGIGDTSVVASNYKDFDLVRYGNGEYFVLTFPMSHAKYKSAHEISCFRPQLSYAKNVAGENLSLAVDYLYVGPKESLPLPLYTVTFLDEGGQTLGTATVQQGETAVYTGKTPEKAHDRLLHYVFQGWDKSLENVREDLTVTAQFLAVEHSYKDGKCSCGEPEEKEPVLEPSWKLSHSLNLASDISVNFVIQKTMLEGFDLSTVYVETVLDVYEGSNKVGVNKVKLLPVDMGYFYYFTLSGLTAIEMNDCITSTLYASKEGQPYASVADEYSIATYAYSQLKKSEATEVLKTLCADLLRYGAMAQLYKDYRTDSLADSAMTEEQRIYLSNLEEVTFGNVNEDLKDLENAPVIWAGKSLSLESKVCLKFVFRLGAYEGPLEDLNLRVSYEDLYGETLSLRVAELEVYNASMQAYAFTVDSLLAAELRSAVSVQVCAGDLPVSSTFRYSPDTYGNNKTGTLGELCKALFVYSDSAKAYFTN